MKITFLGDLTCDLRMLAAAKQSDGSYDFRRSLQYVPDTLKDSDAVVGNLETVFAGAKAGYNPWLVSYNSPDELLNALREIGITVFTTANNHSLDMGVSGLRRTLDLMDRFGLSHTGTFRKPDEQRWLALQVGDVTLGLVAFADALNLTPVGVQQSLSALRHVNHLHPYQAAVLGCTNGDLFFRRLM